MLLDLVVIVEPGLSACDESTSSAGIAQTFLSEQSILLIKILVAPLLYASHLTVF